MTFHIILWHICCDMSSAHYQYLWAHQDTKDVLRLQQKELCSIFYPLIQVQGLKGDHTESQQDSHTAARVGLEVNDLAVFFTFDVGVPLWDGHLPFSLVETMFKKCH